MKTEVGLWGEEWQGGGEPKKGGRGVAVVKA